MLAIRDACRAGHGRIAKDIAQAGKWGPDWWAWFGGEADGWPPVTITRSFESRRGSPRRCRGRIVVSKNWKASR